MAENQVNIVVTKFYDLCTMNGSLLYSCFLKRIQEKCHRKKLGFKLLWLRVILEAVEGISFVGNTKQISMTDKKGAEQETIKRRIHLLGCHSQPLPQNRRRYFFWYFMQETFRETQNNKVAKRF